MRSGSRNVSGSRQAIRKTANLHSLARRARIVAAASMSEVRVIQGSQPGTRLFVQSSQECPGTSGPT